MMGKIFSYVVGMHHFRIPVSKGEKVNFERETDRKSDQNAIRALNMQNKILGYLPSQISAILSPVIDKKYIHVKGYVYKNASEHNAPLVIEVFQSVEGTKLLGKIGGDEKENEVHNSIVDIYLNADKYTSGEILRFRNYYLAQMTLPESKLMHKLLEYKQLRALNVSCETKDNSLAEIFMM